MWGSKSNSTKSASRVPALVFDATVLLAFAAMKLQSDPAIVLDCRINRNKRDHWT